MSSPEQGMQIESVISEKQQGKMLAKGVSQRNWKQVISGMSGKPQECMSLLLPTASTTSPSALIKRIGVICELF